MAFNEARSLRQTKNYKTNRYIFKRYFLTIWKNRRKDGLAAAGRRQLRWARNVFKDEWRLVSKRIMTGNKD